MACLFQSYLVFQYLLQEFLDQAIALHFFGKLEINSTSLQVISFLFQTMLRSNSWLYVFTYP
jgi:hypothetical protein